MQICNCSLTPEACKTCKNNINAKATYILPPYFEINIKPPVGVIPKQIWIEKRIEELQRAIKEYAEAGLKINEDWVTELNKYLGR